MYKKITLFFVFAVLLGMGSAWAQDPCTKTYSVCSGESVVLSHDASCGNGGHYVWAAFEDDCNYFYNGVLHSSTYQPVNCAIGAGWGDGENPAALLKPNTTNVANENRCHYPGSMTIDIKNINSNDPYIYFPIPGGADPSIYKYFIIRYRVNYKSTGDDLGNMELFFFNSNHTNTASPSNSYRVLNTHVNANGTGQLIAKCSTDGYTEVVVDASTNGHWRTNEGLITGFRLDPITYNTSGNKQVHMSIDYIGLVASYPGSSTFTLPSVQANTTMNSYQINKNGSVSVAQGNNPATPMTNPAGVIYYGWTSTGARHDVQVYPALNAGTIVDGSKQICYNAAGLPVTIANQTAASGGSGTISYQWYVTNGGNTTAITGATSEDYTIPNSYATNPGTYVFTRQAISSACESTPKTSEGDYTLTVLPQLSVNPSPLSPAITYGESVDINVVTSSYGIVSTSGLPNGVSYNTSTGHIVGTPTAAGTYNYSVSVTDAGGCGPATATGTITVKKRTVTVSVADATKTYNGSEQSGNTELSFSGLLNGHTGSISYTPAKGTNASTTPYDNGSYGTNFKVMSGSTDVTANYNLTTKSKGKLTINQKSLTITAKAQEYTYNGSAQGENNQTYTSNISSKVTVSGLVGSDALTSITLNGRETNVGTYSSKIVPSAAAISGGAGNYNITYTAGQLKINPKAVTITAKPQTYTYTGQAQGENNATYTSNIASKVEVSGLVSGHSLTSIKLNGRETNAGTYNGKIVPSAAAVGGNTSNYSFTYNAGTLTIDKASIIIKANDASKVYGTADPSSFTATVTGKPANGVNPVYTVTRPDAGTTAGENVGPHTLTVTANAASNPNYNITVQGGTFTITCKPVTVTAVNKEKYYNDPDPELTATVSGTLNNDPITYSVARADVGTTAGETVGDHTITVSGNTTQGNYCVTFVPGKLTIKARPNVTVTVTGHTSTVTYNGTLQSVSGYDFGTLPAGLSISDFTAPAQASVTASGTNVKTENDGKYMMGLTPSDFTNNNPNFIVTFEVEDGWLKITPVTDVVTVNIVGAHDSKVHDGTAHSINGYTINSISNSLYTATDFTKPAQDAAVATANRTNVGTTMMVLSAADFVNTNNNFSNVVFNVTPGYQTIKPANVLVCNGASVPAVNFAPETGMSYEWSATGGDAIGMSTTTGTGNIPSFTASNTGNAVKTATVTVAPKCTRGGVVYSCESFSYTITVRPQVTVTAPVIQACAENQGKPLTLSATVTNAQAGSTLTWTFNAGEQTGTTVASATQDVTASVTVPEVSATTDKPYYINYNDGICTAVCTSQVHVTKVTLAETTTAHTDVTCFGGSNGAFTVVAAGGTAGCSYTVDDWTTSNNDGVFSGMPVPAVNTSGTDPNHPDWETVTGDYTVKVKDANNCVAETTVTVFSPARVRWQNCPNDIIVCCGPGEDYAYLLPGEHFPKPYLNTEANILRPDRQIRNNAHTNNQYNSNNSPYIVDYMVNLDAECHLGDTCSFTITVLPNPTLTPSVGTDNPEITICHNTTMDNIVFNYANATITTEGSLPAGVTMTPAAPAAGTGTITFSGMPQNTGTTQATYSFKVKAASNQVDGEGATCTGNNVEQTVTITVNPVTDATISTTGGDVSQAVCVGQAITPVVFNGNGTLTAQDLPAGLTFSETTPRTLSGTPTEEGTYTVKASDQYECSTDSKQGTITLKPVPTLDIDKPTQTKTYGQDMETVNVTYTNATVSLTNKPDWMTSTEGTGTLALSGTPTAAGTYEVTVTATSTQGCDPVEKTVKVVVDPLAVTVNITGNNDTKTYDAAEHEVTGYTATATSALYKVSGDTPDFGLKSGETASAKRTDVGTTNMGLTTAKFENHNGNFTVTFAIAADGYMEIDPLAVTVNITGNNDTKTYDAAEHEVTGYTATATSALYKVSGDTPDFGLKSGETASAKRTDVGTTDMGLTTDMFENHNGNFTVTFAIAADGYMKIDPLAVTVTITGNNDTKTYDAAEHEVTGYTATATSALYKVSGDTPDFGLKSGETASAKRTDVGTTDMGLTTDMFENHNSNFTVTFAIAADGYMTIDPLAVTVNITGNNDTKTYDAAEHEVTGYTATATSALYKVSGDMPDFGLKSGETASAKRTDVGTTNMGLTTAKFENHNSNFTVTFAIAADGYMKIDPLAVTVTITGNNDTKTYDGEEHEVTGYTATATSALYKVSGDTPDFGLKSGETASAKRTDVGTTDMGLTPAKFENHNSNFTVTFAIAADGYMEIDPLAVTVNITGNNGTKTYDAAEHEVTGYTATATSALYKVSGDTPDFGLKSGETASAKRTDVGTTDMGLTTDMFENHNSNFTVTFAIAADGYMKVTKRSLTLTSATDSREYNGNWLTNSTVNVTGEGWATGEGATYNVTGKQLLPGHSDNTFTYTLNSNTLASNYDINVVFGTLTVTDRTEPYQITVTSNSNTSPITYDGLEHNVNGFVTNTFTTVDGNTYTVEGLSASVTEIFAGTYPNTITGTAVVKDEYGNDVTSQFDVSKVTGNLTIGKRPISFTIAAENASKVYDGTPLTVSYNQLTVNGLASTDQLIGGTITTNDFTVGLYPISEGNMFRMMAEKASTKSGFSIKHSSGELAKTLASYAPTFNITLSITSRPLTLIADDATKVYDGTPLTSNGFTLTSTLGTGDAVSATVNGSQTCVGESANVIDPATVQVMHDNGDGTFTDVTSSYGPVTLTDGVLKVTPVTSGFSCPAAITITLTEGKFDTIVSQSLLGNPSHDLMTVGRAQAANNLAALNPMDEGDHTVVWTLYDDCGNAMTSCEQVVTVVYAPCEPVLGYDGHDYDAVRIGYQCWMTENLRNTVDADGHPIADYHAYKENPDNMEKFGYLYTWYSAVGVPEGDDSAAPTTKVGADGQPYVQGICPENWGVASAADISILNYAAGDVMYLKDTDSQYWTAGNAGQEPNTGFKDRANGRYNSTLGRYEGIYSNSYFWASDATPNSSVAVGAEINYYCSSILTQGYPKADRQGVRCVKKQ